MEMRSSNDWQYIINGISKHEGMGWKQLQYDFQSPTYLRLNFLTSFPPCQTGQLISFSHLLVWQNKPWWEIRLPLSVMIVMMDMNDGQNLRTYEKQINLVEVK